MKYAKILADKHIYTRTKHLMLVKDELYTIAELNKLNREFGIDREDYTIIDIPKSQTYWFCGARKQTFKGGEL